MTAQIAIVWMLSLHNETMSQLFQWCNKMLERVVERPDQAGVGIDEMQFGFMPDCCSHRRSAWLQTSLSQGWTQWGCLHGGRHWKQKAWIEQHIPRALGEYERGVELPSHWSGVRNFFLNLCLWECISSHFDAHFSITSMLSTVRHSNTLFLTISFAFPCRPLGALVRFPCGHSNCNASLSQPNVQKNSRALVRRKGLKFEEK